MQQDPTLQHPIIRLLNTSWPLFTAFGVRVRVSWTALIWPLIFSFFFLEWLSFGEALGWGAAWTLVLFASVWTHEMGHIWMGRRHGIDTERITLRGLGGLAHLLAPPPTPKADVQIALAGPALTVPWVILLYPLGWLLQDAAPDANPGWMVEGMASMQLWMLVFNLLPIYPLDGGRAFRGFLAMRMHANKATLWAAKVGKVGNAALVVVGLATWLFGVEILSMGRFGFLLAWIGFEGWRACKQLELEATHGDPYNASDPFAATIRESEALARADDAAERKEREARQKQRAERDRLQSTVDRLLDRINEVGGMGGLSAREQKELKQASAALAAFDDG